MAKKLVGILMGSDSDMPVMAECVKILQEFHIPYEITISSAHRSPKRISEYAKTASERSIKVIIAGAGSAAHLAGFIASQTTLPVIGVPIDSSSLKGLDALLSTVQMPGGVPVATMSIGKAGAKNAAIFAVQMLALNNKRLAKKLREYKVRMAREIDDKAKNIEGKQINADIPTNR